MERLIDADALREQISKDPREVFTKHQVWLFASEHNKTVPTVDAIPKADYEARLKADMVAILTELQLEIKEIVMEEEPNDKKWARGLHYSEKIIQQKIDEHKKHEINQLFNAKKQEENQCQH